jgi:hypothetical protein
LPVQDTSVKFLLVIVVAVAVVVGLAALGSSSEPEGNPDVYSRISSLTDCAELQREFDTADANRKFSDDPEIQTSYMEAAHERMQELGC